MELTFQEGGAAKKDDQYRYNAKPEIKVTQHSSYPPVVSWGAFVYSDFAENYCNCWSKSKDIKFITALKMVNLKKRDYSNL